MAEDKTPLMVLEEFVQENKSVISPGKISVDILLYKIQSLKGMEEEVINEAYEKGIFSTKTLCRQSDNYNYYQSKFGNKWVK